MFNFSWWYGILRVIGKHDLHRANLKEEQCIVVYPYSRSSLKRPPKMLRLSGRLRAVVVDKKEGRKDERMESGIRGQQTCPLTIYINIWTVSSDISIQRRHWQPLSVHLMSLLYPAKPWCDWFVKVGHTTSYHQGLRPLLFSNSGVGSFTSYKNQIN